MRLMMQAAPLLHEFFRPVGHPEVFDLGKRLLASLADTCEAYFPASTVTDETSLAVWKQLNGLFDTHHEGERLRMTHRLTLLWLAERARVTPGTMM